MPALRACVVIRSLIEEDSEPSRIFSDSLGAKLNSPLAITSSIKVVGISDVAKEPDDFSTGAFVTTFDTAMRLARPICTVRNIGLKSKENGYT